MTQNLENLKKKAYQLLNDKNWDELIPICTEIIELGEEPSAKAFAYYLRGYAYSKKGNSEQAMGDFFSFFGSGGLDQVIEDFTSCFSGVAYSEKGDYDQAIAEFTRVLDSKPNNGEAYFNRGFAYIKKGNHDKAMADLNKALEFNPNDARVYFSRGVLYGEKGDFDRAMEDFNKALKLNPNHAEAYHCRAVTYYRKGNFDRAIKDFNKALELNPDYAQTHFSRGLIYFEKEDYAQAITDLNKALELKPIGTVREKAHLLRGAIYLLKGNFLNAFNDFVDSNKCNPDLKFISSLNYVAFQIADIYKRSKKEDKAKAFELYSKLLDSILEIQLKQFYEPEEGREVAHYTSLRTLKDLANEGHFHFYNATYMNDPEEGSVFFDIMKESGIDVKEGFYGEDEDPPYPSPAYIGSFVMVDSENQESKDKLFLWRTYGKHDGQEAAGACLIFRHEGTCFAKTYEPRVGDMQRLQSERSMVAGDLKKLGERQHSKPTLYKILYMDKGSNKELSEELNELAESLKQVKHHVSKTRGNRKNRLKRLACELLDNIRFLFKASHYKEEQEVRVIQFYYYDENMSQEPDGIKVDTEQIPPHFYLDAYDGFRFDEIILGPEAHSVREWTQWLKKHGIKAKKSEIKYGKQSF